MTGKLFARKFLIASGHSTAKRLLGYLAVFLATLFAYLKRSYIPVEVVYGFLLLLVLVSWEIFILLLRYWAATEKRLDQLETRYSKRSGTKITHVPPGVLKTLQEMEARNPKREFEE